MTILDSNIWIAFLNTNDSQHKEAVKVFWNLKDDIAITQDIIIEIVTILLQKSNKSIVNTFIELVLNNSEIELIFTSKEFVINLLDFIANNDHMKLWAVDHSLLILSKHYKIISFDKNLNKAIRK